jgi:hypothetical protein
VPDPWIKRLQLPIGGRTDGARADHVVESLHETGDQATATNKDGKSAALRTTIGVFVGTRRLAQQMMIRILFATLLAALTSLSVAQPSPTPYPQPPDLPPASYQGETVEPEVTILETERGIVYEYRVRGQLYMIRIQPPLGPPYYLLDTNGDGIMDAREDRVWNNAIPQWVLFSW